MFKFSRPQKGNNNTKIKGINSLKNINFVEKPDFIRFFSILKPFCYEQTSPLGVGDGVAFVSRRRNKNDPFPIVQFVRFEKFLLSPEKEGA